MPTQSSLSQYFTRGYSPSYVAERTREVQRRSQAATRIQRAYRGSKTRRMLSSNSRRPTRYGYSRSVLRKNLKVARVMSMFAEKKYKALTPQDEVAPAPIAVGSPTYWLGYVLGKTVPVTWVSPTAWNTLNACEFIHGIGNNTREGRYMYLNNTTVNCSVHMNAQERNTPPVQFRMVVFKARRATTPTGVSYNPGESLFLNSEGTPVGFNAGMLGNDIMLQPLNKRAWIILQDKRFTLQAPMASPSNETSSFQGKYASYKRMRINLNHQIKAAFNAVDLPENYDYNFGIVIFSNGIGNDTLSNQWEFNLRGTTTAFDN